MGKIKLQQKQTNAVAPCAPHRVVKLKVIKQKKMRKYIQRPNKNRNG